MLKARALVAGYGGDPIVRGVDIDVQDGEVVVALGPNGAGKSTLMKAIFGELPLTSGQIFFDDLEMTDLPAHERIKQGLGYVPQLQRVFPTLSVTENLEMGAYAVKGSLSEQFERVFTLFPDLKRDRRRQAGVLSGGQQAMLGIGRALMGNAKMLLLDEPTAGMSPAYVDRMWDAVDRIRASGIGIFAVEQNVAQALSHSDVGYVLVDGQVAAHDACSALVERSDVEGLFVG